MPRIRRILATAAGVIALAIAAIAAAALWLVHASLPRDSGRFQVSGLQQAITIDDDSLGVPTIAAPDLASALFGLGFVHARDRFFQMDLLRRLPAGELAALLGRAALGSDRKIRVHRFRDVARHAYAAATPAERERCDAYTRGVQAGLASLHARPFEYFLLREYPAPWLPEDSYLVILSMFLQLQDANGETESAVTLLYEALPESLAAFADLRGTAWDAPLDGSAMPAAPIPSAAVLDLRHAGLDAPAGGGATSAPGDDGALDWALVARADRDLGSNNFAVAGSRMADGQPWLAGDMHLSIAVPNTWYRAALVVPACTVTGVTLPGAPAVIAGSNGGVVWAFTNSETDASDLVVLEPDSSSSRVGTYRTPQGPRAFEVFHEPIAVHGGRTDTLRVEQTIWGPVVGADARGRRRALRWTAHEPAALNLLLGDMTGARSVEDVLRMAPRWGIPAQNVLAADRAGHIGWAIAGRLPKRFGFDGRRAGSWAAGDRGWDGWLDAADSPRVVDPADGVLCTANQRCVGGEALVRIGDGGYGLGARAVQIRTELLQLHGATAADLLRVQLDDRAVFLTRWHDLMLSTLDAEAGGADSRRVALRRTVENWGGHAGIESVGYRAVRMFRAFLLDDVFRGLTAACTQADAEFNVSAFPQREEPVWRLLMAQPPHLLDPRYPNWRACVLAAVDSTLGRMAPGVAAGAPETAVAAALASRTWGVRNTTSIRHPLSAAVPVLAHWLDMPRHALPGDSNMPRVQWPSGGASQRMVISPGQEVRSLFHMPCGQSGHPSSPHYRDAHAGWEQGLPAPFLPGAAQHQLRLIPEPNLRRSNG